MAGKRTAAAITVTAAATKLGSIGGKKGGPARARNLSPAERAKIARMGGKARQARGAAKAKKS